MEQVGEKITQLFQDAKNAAAQDGAYFQKVQPKVALHVWEEVKNQGLHAKNATALAKLNSFKR
jgi:hypothetical protein